MKSTPSMDVLLLDELLRQSRKLHVNYVKLELLLNSILRKFKLIGSKIYISKNNVVRYALPLPAVTPGNE